MAGELERNTRKRAEHCVSDFEKYAQMKLDSNAWGYYSSGANMEQTLRDNKEAFQRYIAIHTSLFLRHLASE